MVRTLIIGEGESEKEAVRDRDTKVNKVCQVGINYCIRKKWPVPNFTITAFPPQEVDAKPGWQAVAHVHV